MLGRTSPSRAEGWLARLPDWAGRSVGVACFGVAAAWRWGSRDDYSNGWLFALEFAIPAWLMIMYLTRSRRLVSPQGWRATWLPLCASVLPFVLLLPPRTAFGIAHQAELLALLCVPTALMVWSYACLNTSFAVMAEARTLKKSGPYRCVRHPVYTAQLACALLVLVWRFSWFSLGVYAIFVWAQVTRARAEEAALLRAHSEYRAYAESTWTFIPWLY